MAWTTSGQVITPSSFHDFPAGTFDDGGQYEWQVRTWDAQGEVGPWSASNFFDAATPPPGRPTIISPVNGSTIGLAEVVLEWSYPSQDAYQWQVLDGATVIEDSGQVASTTTRAGIIDDLPNNVTRTLRVRVEDGGLWSQWASVTVTVAYSPPPTPTVQVDETSAPAAYMVRGLVPTPGVGEPNVTHLDIYRREGTDTGDGIRRAKDLAPSRVFTDYFVASGVDYFYRVKAYGENGTIAWSGWSGEPIVIIEDIDGGTPATSGDDFLDGGSI